MKLIGQKQIFLHQVGGCGLSIFPAALIPQTDEAAFLVGGLEKLEQNPWGWSKFGRPAAALNKKLIRHPPQKP
jgi:hypothetical protein